MECTEAAEGNLNHKDTKDTKEMLLRVIVVKTFSFIRVYSC